MTAIASPYWLCFLFFVALSTVAWNCHFTWLTAKSQAIKELVVVLIVLTRGEVWGGKFMFHSICLTFVDPVFWFIVWLRLLQDSELNYKVSFQLQQILSGSCCVSLNGKDWWIPSVRKHALHMNNHGAEDNAEKNRSSTVPLPFVCVVVFCFFLTLRMEISESFGKKSFLLWNWKNNYLMFYVHILESKMPLLNINITAGCKIWTNLA